MRTLPDKYRLAAVKRAEAWTRGQATRLGVSPDDILGAVRRGWLPEHLERVSHAVVLQGDPPSAGHGLSADFLQAIGVEL